MKYTMNNTQYGILVRAINAAFTEVEVLFEESYGREDIKGEWKVNWGCRGAQSTEEAEKFSEELNKAVRLAEHLNEVWQYIDRVYECDFSYDKDEIEYNVEDLAKAIRTQKLGHVDLSNVVTAEA